ncbi:MAG TPA: IPT/TIG domain-containing protein, partial [Solirubrobacterales bacterium]|nr:IPT/TIG domain-containing protein [Solirubrobacterales bacterium]
STFTEWTGGTGAMTNSGCNTSEHTSPNCEAGLAESSSGTIKAKFAAPASPTPTCTATNPTKGPTEGGNEVEITGTNLTNAKEVKFSNSGVVSPPFLENSPTNLKVYAPHHLAGLVTVKVITAGGTASCPSQYEYVERPTVTSVSPSQGPTGGGQTVTITGNELANASAVHFGTAEVKESEFKSDNATQVVVETPIESAGTVDVTVTTAGGTSSISRPSDEYTYFAPPIVTSVVPSEGPLAGGNTVVIHGTNFGGATEVSLGSTAVSCPQASPHKCVVNANEIEVETPSGSAGAVDVTVTTPGGTSATSAADQYSYVGEPTVTSVVPNEGPTEGGNEVEIEGTNLKNASLVKFGSTLGTSVISVSSTKLTVKTPPGSVGTVDVVVTAPGGTSAISPADHYTYVIKPTVTSVTPREGPTSGGTLVTIAGSDLSGASKVEFGNKEVKCPKATAPEKCVVKGASEIEVEAPGHAAGTFDVTVTTPGGPSLAVPMDEFTFVGPPVVTKVSPAKGATSGGEVVTITGSQLTAASDVAFGTAEVPAAQFIEGTATQIKLHAPAHAAGAVHVQVTTLGGTSGKFAADEYTYVAPLTLSVTKAGSGSGKVSCDGGPCASSYPYGSTVTLTAAADPGSTFAGFSGACAGTGSCTLTLEADAAITATFNAQGGGNGGGNGGGETPLSPAAQCIVPKLAGKTLKQAKSALKKAQCALGKVTKPKKHTGKLVVKSSSPAAGAKLAADSKVAIRLKPVPASKPKKSHDRRQG